MLEGWEWIIIGVVAIVIILWGPSKIPEFAKALGRAKGEFSKAQKDFTEAAANPPPTQTGASSTPAAAAPAVPHQTTIRTKDEMLIETAQKLGVSTEGKTREEITEEISVKVKLLSATQ